MAEVDTTATPSPWPARRARVRSFVIDNWLPLSFAVAVILALAWPYPGSQVVAVTVWDGIRIVQEICMVIVFFIQGLTLDTQDLRKAKGHIWGVLFGFVSILFLTPLVGIALRYVPLQPQPFVVGLVIYCLVPTTLGVGVALVRAAKGNEGVALLLTVGSNMLGVGTMPGMLMLLFAGYDTSSLSVKFNAVNLLAKLTITTLAPSVIGKLTREFITPARNFATRYKVALGMTSTFLLAFIIWQSLSAARPLLFQSPGWSIVSVIFLTSGTHIFYLLANYAVIRYFFRLPYPEAVSLVIIASQKSAPVGYTIIAYIAGSSGDLGLMAVPLLVGQIAQIFIGSALVPFLVKYANAYADKEAAKESLARESDGGLHGPEVTHSHTGGAGPETVVTDDVSDGKEIEPVDARIDMVGLEVAGLQRTETRDKLTQQ